MIVCSQFQKSLLRQFPVCRAFNPSDDYRKKYYREKVRQLEQSLAMTPRELYCFDLKRILTEKWGEDTCISIEKHEGKSYLKVYKTIEDCSKDCETISKVLTEYNMGESLTKVIRAHPHEGPLERGSCIFLYIGVSLNF